MAKTNGAVTNKDLLGGVNLAVASDAVVYTESFVIPKNASFGVEIKLTSAGTAKVNVELEQGNIPPVTEAAADTNMVVPEGESYLVQITDELVHVFNFNPIVSNFLRLKITGVEDNAATTEVERLDINHIVNL